MLQGGAGTPGTGEWTGTSYSTTTSTKTSQRTYADSDGTEVTEVSTFVAIFECFCEHSVGHYLPRNYCFDNDSTNGDTG